MCTSLTDAIAIPPIALTRCRGKTAFGGGFRRITCGVRQAVCRKPGKRPGIVPRLAPPLIQRELAGWRVLSGSQTVWIAADHIADPAEGTNIVNLKMGGRLGVGRSSVYVGYGRGLTDAVWYKNLVRAEYRYSF